MSAHNHQEMDLSVDHDQVDQSNSFGVKERRAKCGKSHESSWKVEIRSKLFEPSRRIWVGSFKTREEANKACDAALHYLRRPTLYYTYPTSGYFREIGELPQDQDELKTLVKSLAKEYANYSLPIITAPPTVVASENSAPELDNLALQNFETNPTVRNVCGVGRAHNTRATYLISSPRVPDSSSSSPFTGWLAGFMAEDPKPEDQSSLMDSNEYKQLYGELTLVCREIPACEVAEGHSDVANKSTNKDVVNDFIDSIDSPLASVPRLQAHSRRHSPEFAKIEGTDKSDQLEHEVMSKFTVD